MNEVLQVRGLSVRYPLPGGLLGRAKGYVHAVRGVDLGLGRGESLGLVGESGCGKSTIASALVGLAPWYSGSLDLMGESLDPLTEGCWKQVRQKIGIVFQDPHSAFNPRATVYESLSAPLRQLSGLTAAQARDEVARLLSLVGLSPDDMDRWPHAFSGGQRQRIGIARALARSPQILVCDEITSALDVSVQAQILHLLGDLQQQLGLALLFISHDIGVVRALCTRIAVMYAGRIVEEGPSAEVLQSPWHPYTQALLAALPGQGGTPTALVGEVPSGSMTGRACAFALRCPYATQECSGSVPPPLDRQDARYVECFHPLARTGALRVDGLSSEADARSP